MKSIYAEVNKKLLEVLENGGRFNLPDGVSCYRKSGKRDCYFEVEDDDGFEDLVEMLDQMGINWQEQ